MTLRMGLLALIVMFVAAACSSEGLPRVTPTVAPTDTPQDATRIAQLPSRTPIITSTSTEAPSRTPSATPTETLTPTNTSTPSDTPEPTTTDTPNPSETFTRTPTNTATSTATVTATATDTPSPTQTATNTATSTFTLTATNTPSETPTDRPTALPVPNRPTNTATATITPTVTPSNTPEPTETNTPDPSATPSPTATASVTPSPLLSATPTATEPPTATAEPSATNTPAQTNTPTLSADQIGGTATDDAATEIALSATATPDPFDSTATAIVVTLTAIADDATARALTETAEAITPTPPPIQQTATQIVSVFLTQTAQPTPTPGPTIDETPTFITATPGAEVTLTPPEDDLGIIDPPVSEEDTIPAFPSETPLPLPPPPPTATTVFPTMAPLVDLPATLPSNWQSIIVPRDFSNVNTQTFTVGSVIDLTQGTVGVSLSVGGLPTLFARNPVNPNSYAQTSETGALRVNAGAGGYMPSEPFSPYVGTVGLPEQNDYFVSAVSWSPDGRWLAFIVDGDRGGHPSPTGEDGLHIVDAAGGGVITLMRDCPYETHPGCDLGGSRDFYHESNEIHWSPDGSRMLIRARITDDWAGANQGALFVVPLDQPPNRQPQSLRYDYGSWTVDGTQVVVTNGGTLGTINAEGNGFQAVYNSAGTGRILQHGVQASNGAFFALARDSRDGPAYLIDGAGNALTGPIGASAPEAVTWNGARSAVSVLAGGQQYVAYTNGRVESAAPGSEVPGGATVIQVPSGVVEGSRFAPGQQVQMLWEQINIRPEPGTDNTPFAFLTRGEYVRIIAGPVTVEGFEWWQLQRANGSRGWIAALINGQPTFAAAS